MAKIGILGGTFDPIHYGHLFIAENARRQFQLDKVLLIPAGTPPHKTLVSVSDKAHRFQMTALAVRGNAGFEVSDIEVAREGVSYTVDTVTALRNASPDTEFYYILGADALCDLVNWKSFKRLSGMITLVAVNRTTDRRGDAAEAARTLTEKYHMTVHTQDTPGIEISSTEIRRRVREGLPVRYLLPDAVARYIAKQKLYR
ncbi:MAG: nicotinate-nucleotide adenylyltransferase [Clostridiales bacterium]|jgi:nicotinate-nucleotide adenylyltransferase|nr:nicotinate-nucleotide adenylyltransferase [Clostridiales bacterium]